MSNIDIREVGLLTTVKIWRVDPNTEEHFKDDRNYLAPEWIDSIQSKLRVYQLHKSKSGHLIDKSETH